MLGAFLGGLLQERFSFALLVSSAQWLAALVLPLSILVANVIWLAGVIVVLSAVITVYGVVQFSYRLALIPDELQGRVNSVFRLVVFGGDPLGLALTGLLLQVIGVVPTVVIYAGCFVVLALATTLNRHVHSTPPLADLKTV
jgi:predicted MFS family arabinose efflux permease